MEHSSSSSESIPHQSTPSLFPLFHLNPNPTPQNDDVSSGPEWLSNPSFTTDLSLVTAAVSQYDTVFKSSTLPLSSSSSEDDDRDTKNRANHSARPQYNPVDSHASDHTSSENKKESNYNNEKKRRKKKKKRRNLSGEAAEYGGLSSRKADVKSWWSTSNSSTSNKEYYFDSRGDRDNLAFGCIYRMDVARYKPHSAFGSGVNYALYRHTKKSSAFDGDNDVDALDSKSKSAGRYWSAAYTALERHKNIKRLRIVAHQNRTVSIDSTFVPLLDDYDGSDGGSASRESIIEESWGDVVLRKTREFNKMTREYPHNEKGWLDFADFQDKVASMQPQKGARLQTLEKKISILEKAVEVNPDSEELLLSLMNTYRRRDSIDILIARWEKILVQHSGNWKLWREFLLVVKGEFSRFKVPEMRKIYGNAIGALSATRGKQYRQVNQTVSGQSFDPTVIQKELGLVDIFLSLCRFEWQAGYQELATALLQSEIEYCLFCPTLFLGEQSKLRLFEYFWNSNGARVGEDGALGWSNWLEKEEDQKRKAMNEELEEMDEGGWTGWSEPLSKSKGLDGSSDNAADTNMDVEEFDDEIGPGDAEPEKDTATLLKMLGIEANAESIDEIKDTETWVRWSKEELSRDSDQWMPLHAKDGVSHGEVITDREGDEQFSRVILFEEISEYLFSVSSQEACLSLIFQFIDFYGGRISGWTSTNSSTWGEKILSLEALPDSILDDLRKVHNVLTKAESSPSSFLEFSLGASDDNSMRTNMMKFLRNAILLFLTAFPKNHILEEALLVSEELSNTGMNSISCSVTPCRALAKSLLKRNRQDFLLCGVYARREAAFGNVDHARKVFDMALASIEAVPLDSQSDAFLIFFWYAEVELANSSSGISDSRSRAMHILYCLGSGVKYTPFTSQPSSVQQLRARQGFKERIRIVRARRVHGNIDEKVVALICSAALFEELTSGWISAIEVFDQAFSMVLPERRTQSQQLEFLLNYYVKMLWKYHQQSDLPKVWDAILQGLQLYPQSPALYYDFIEIGYFHTSVSKMRWIFDDNCQKKPSVIVWLFALSFEISRRTTKHRVRALFERALGTDSLHKSVILWRWYITYETNVACDPSAARRIYFRAIHACPWSKKLWLDGFLKLNSILTAKELSDLQEVMRDKELNLRTDIYEILLQDEVEL